MYIHINIRIHINIHIRIHINISKFKKIDIVNKFDFIFYSG